MGGGGGGGGSSPPQIGGAEPPLPYFNLIATTLTSYVASYTSGRTF